MANSTSALHGCYSQCSALSNGSAKAGRVRCTASASPPTYVRAHVSPLPPPQPQPMRRSGNYRPNSWDYKLIRSLKGGYLSESQITQIEKLKENVKQLMYKKDEPAAKLKLVDALQRLGIAYHFEKEIKNMLSSISIDDAKVAFEEDIFLMALLFRLLRENGFSVSQDLLSGFKDIKGHIKPYLQKKDVLGLLSLYEASYFGFEGERIWEEARIFTTKHLNELKPYMDPNLKAKVVHALELPLHWRPPRLEARSYIEQYERDEDVELVVLQLAKLDFNRVQIIHQEELKRISRWWRDVALAENLSFARDRIIECFFTAAGVVFEPQLGHCRESLAKVCTFITVVDDVYDVYGTVDELVLFTSAVERWENDAVEGLPNYMKTLYSTLYNTTNEMACHMLREKVEAKWHHNGYKPTLREYLENGWMSSSGNVILLHAFALTGEKVAIETLRKSENYQGLVRSSSSILRLCNDLATYTAEREKGDAPSSIDCYMQEHDTNEEESREAVRDLIVETWKKMNKDAYDRCRLPRSFTNSAMNLGRISHCLYQNGDGISAPNQEKKYQINSLFLEPILVKGSEN
ncbi:Myrcene synthase, chloroplastic [Ananas comosus]|uniref:Myrcene synthase, chloroplastic n=1 Tax=Ananas comosus TaxID=4615 RepID=A0A199UHJ7_ANACO|nr:Myrcene synthase, chloroplastic [Ananas comosus]